MIEDAHTLEIRNRLLASLKTEDLTLLKRQLREVPIEQGEMLEQPGGFVDAVYFPQTGMILLIVQMPEDSSVEVGTVGSEGAIGMAVGLGSRVSFICAMVQVSGIALCIPASRFRAAAGQSAPLQTSDKIESDTIPFTHEFLSNMLGVRRSTVSQIASELQTASLLHTHRGQIKLLKRAELKKRACPCYEIARRHIERLIPHSHPIKKERV